VDEADEVVAQRVSRRRFLAGAGAATTAALLPNALAVPAGAAVPHGEKRPNHRTAPNVVIVGSGIAGLGCAYSLWRRHGIQASVYEYNTIPGGRIRTLRGFFDDDQIVEEHAEFINPEHTATLALARSLGLTLDNTDKYPPGTHPKSETMSFFGHSWPQASLLEDWHEWAWKLFHDAAAGAGGVTTFDKNTAAGRQIDQMSVNEWIDANIPGGVDSDFGALCQSAVLDEYGGPNDEQSALNLVYLLGQDATEANSQQPHSQPALGGANEKWHVHGGTDLLISGLLERLPAGTLNLDQKLVALRSTATGYTCTFQSGAATHDVTADHVVLALPFTTLRQVDLSGVSIAPLHRVAINGEPLGSNAKFFVQCTSRVWNTVDHVDGNAYDLGVVQGAWDPTIYQPGQAGVLAALPGGTSAQNWGTTYGLSGYFGTPPAAMLEAFLRDFNTLFPGVEQAYNGLSHYVWSTGDPHILGAYSYLKVGQYTGFNGIQGQREGNVHFAGEQTSVDYQGYIEGGLRSGYRCADEIVAKN
jgi:monoamine oxidase